MEDALKRLPVPDAVSFGGLKAGEEPYVTLTYKLGVRDAELEAVLGVVFGQAKEASADGTIKVEVK